MKHQAHQSHVVWLPMEGPVARQAREYRYRSLGIMPVTKRRPTKKRNTWADLALEAVTAIMLVSFVIAFFAVQ